MDKHRLKAFLLFLNKNIYRHNSIIKIMFINNCFLNKLIKCSVMFTQIVKKVNFLFLETKNKNILFL